MQAETPERVSMRRYFTPAEVAAHNTAADLWLSFLGRVCDLTPLMEQHAGGALLLPIMEFAGQDISSWFDPETKDVSVNPTKQPIRDQVSAHLCVCPLSSGPETRRSTDFLCEVLHPQGALRAHPPRRPTIQLGH
uniref:Cytochrome b5 domain-containing protein 1 n=1 Tax=Cyclopterus lumpus TaxID=8103 RepID=A0A8C2X346_CYCLU